MAARRGNGRPSPNGADGAMAQPKVSSREQFREDFLTFLRLAFNNDPTLTAYTLGVTEQAARNWINGVSLPNGWRLMQILQGHPEAWRCLRLVVDNPAPTINAPSASIDKGRRSA